MDVAGKRIVIIGDSHVDLSWFGKSLEATLTARGAHVVRHGWGGSAASTWLAGKRIFGKQYTLKGVSDAGPYDLALVVLGSNDAANAQRASMEGGPTLAAGVATASQKIWQVAGSLNAGTSFWVGPPAMGTKSPYWTNGAMDALWRATSPQFGKRALDSRPATQTHVKGGDGVHLGKEGADAWTSFVVSEVTKQEAGVGPINVGLLICAAAIMIVATLISRRGS
jgi:hypothetical protein